MVILVPAFCAKTAKTNNASRIPGKKHGIAMTQLKAFTLTNDPDTFHQGATAYRNGRDWTRLQRDQVIAQANERIGLESLESPQGDALGASFTSDASCVTIEVMDQKTITNSGSHAVPSLYESDTSADELSLDFQPPPTKRSRSPQKQSYSAQDQNQSEKADGTSKNPFKARKDFHPLLDNHTGSMQLKYLKVLHTGCSLLCCVDWFHFLRAWLL
jgi:hypothetical protein